MTTNLYHFFNPVNNKLTDKRYIINLTIDSKYEHLQYIYNYFGEVICNETGYVNDIFPTLKNYFGGTQGGFFENLTNFLEQYPKYHLQINIISKNPNIPDTDFFMFLNIFLFYRQHYSDDRLSVYVSMDILKWYGDCCYLFTPKEEFVYFE